MSDDKPDRDCIAESALHQNSEGSMASVYARLPDEDRIALARMITDGR
jgi:hypothetical protein